MVERGLSSLVLVLVGDIFISLQVLLNSRIYTCKVRYDDYVGKLDGLYGCLGPYRVRVANGDWPFMVRYPDSVSSAAVVMW